MKLTKITKILIPIFIVVLVFPIIAFITHAQIKSKTSTSTRPWVECRKIYRQALKDENKLYVESVKAASNNYRQALRETKNISDRDTKRNFLQKAKIGTKEAKKLALKTIKANKKALKTTVKTCEAENK
ncbi:MAG: hypothetical protein WC244_01640 [Patescibacteria group bacterium]|jgi:hypothetical protein